MTHPNQYGFAPGNSNSRSEYDQSKDLSQSPRLQLVPGFNHSSQTLSTDRDGRESGSGVSRTSWLLSNKVNLAIVTFLLVAPYLTWRAGIFAQAHFSTVGGPSGYGYLSKLTPTHFQDYSALFLTFLSLAVFNRKDFFFLWNFARALRHFRIEAVHPCYQELAVWQGKYKEKL